MPTSPPRVIRVVFDEIAFAEDLAHASAAGRAVAADARTRFEAHGIALSQLKRCDADALDQTSLPGCVKTYLPAPVGKWGIVFAAAVEPKTLRVVAFGVRHPGKPWTPSVYEVAHRRLHAAT